MNVKRILVGLDGSPRQVAVLRAAEEIAIRFDAQLLLLRAVGLPPEIPAAAWQNPALTVQEFLERQAKESLEECAAKLPEVLAARYALKVVLATPWEGVCSSAQANAVELIVIGSHGYGGLDRVLGTTAARIVNHAPCSVLVVRTAESSPQ